MLITPPNLSLTLFVSVLLTLAVTSAEAHDFPQANRRDHDNLKRLVRKRSPFPQDLVGDLGVVNVGGPALPSGTSTSVSASATSASASDSAASASSASVSVSASASASAVSTSASASSASVSASQSASVASVSSTSSTTSTTTSTTAAPATTPLAQTADAVPDAQPKSTVTKTSSVVVGAAATSQPAPVVGATTKTKTTITYVLIVVAASVGGVFILWTIFRKWKLGHSSKFNERMAPIDWQPTNDEGIVPAHRRANSRASSFHSSTTHDNAAGHGAGALEHDFSAPPANLAPGGGYADLARGSSPQPQMQEALGRGPSMNRAYNNGLARGPSTTRPYDNGVPLHHQAGYGQAEAYDYNGDAIRF
ncbi:hypothetical protein DFH09DRAFT_1300705 [Mycena vulgaris]|nr:hypothetical protein DFH09DRAFT_1300705 [Mycena vulgaris]